VCTMFVNGTHPDMLTFTLVIATLGRTGELNTLLASIAAQQYPGLDCIVVDQNPDDRLRELLDRWSDVFPIQRLRSAPGLSRARNVGLLEATGDVIAFPDDDCWYPPGLVSEVARWLDEHSEFGILTVGAQDQNGVSSGNRWVRDQCEIRPINAFRTTFSSTIFVRRSAAVRVSRFDEALGVGSGTRYGCGEETDYILNLLRDGERGFFDRTLHIGHPKRDMMSGEIDHKRAVGYGCGMGHVLRKHSMGLLGLSFVGYDLVRSALTVATGDFKASALCVHHAFGVASGYMASVTDN
jgi:glycosyltransferase involved in cell wall biosynthesis